MGHYNTYQLKTLTTRGMLVEMPGNYNQTYLAQHNIASQVTLGYSRLLLKATGLTQASYPRQLLKAFKAILLINYSIYIYIYIYNRE